MHGTCIGCGREWFLVDGYCSECDKSDEVGLAELERQEMYSRMGYDPVAEANLDMEMMKRDSEVVAQPVFLEPISPVHTSSDSDDLPF